MCNFFLYIFLFILKPVKFDMFGLGQALKKNTENFLEGKLHNIDSLAKAWIANVVDKQNKRLEKKYKFPATKKGGRKHRRAMGFGYCKASDKKKLGYCPCCRQPVAKRKLNLCEGTTYLSEPSTPIHIKSAAALFFTFIKSLILYFILHFIVIDAFNLITNLSDGRNCVGDCSSQLFSYASIIYKFNRKDLINVTDALSLVTVILSIVYFLFYRAVQYQVYCIIDKDNLTEDDYSILVEDIPILNFPSQMRQGEKVNFPYDKDLDHLFTEEIKKWISGETNPDAWENPVEGSLEYDYRENIEKQQINFQQGDQGYLPEDIIKSITLCYDIQQIQRLKNLREAVMLQHEQAIKNDDSNSVMNVDIDERFDSPAEQVQFLNKGQINLCERYLKQEDLIFKTTHFVGSAFVSFKYQHYRDYIVQTFTDSPKYFQLKGKPLLISSATSPTEIIWDNMRISRDVRKTREFISNIILLIILVFSFGLLLGTDFLKQALERITKEDPDLQSDELIWGSRLITLGATLITLVINYVLSLVVYEFAKWESHYTYTREKFALVLKLAVSQFVNTALIYYIISVFADKDNDDLLSASGLVYQITSLITTSGIIQIFSNLAYPSAIMNDFFLWWNHTRHEGEEIQLYQVHLNKAYEKAEFDIAARYAYYLLQLYTVSFYAYIVPITVPAIIIILILQYWVDKVNLFRRSSLYYEMHYSLSRDIGKMAELSILMFAGGATFFSYKVHGGVPKVILAALIIAAVYSLVVIFLPQRLEKRILQKYQTLETLSYDQCKRKGKFYNTFWNRNPVTRLMEESSVSGRKIPRDEVNVSMKSIDLENYDDIDDDYFEQFEEEDEKVG